MPITNSVLLTFNKPLDTNTVNAGGIFIRGTNGVVDSTVSPELDTNGQFSLVRIVPRAPLQSKSLYSIFVLSGDLQGAIGQLIGSGPRDLVGRILPATFVSSFVTADNTPPQLLSIFPSNNAVQIDPSAVPRLVFDKTLNSSNFVFSLFGPSGPVAGAPGLGINGQVLSFVPAALLSPNASYTVVVSNVFDLAGNRAKGEPFISRFATIDTIGPTIASLQLASNVAPAAGATVPVIATLATNEFGASVRFTQDFNPIGTATNAPYEIMVTLPSSGSTTVRAIPTDQYGNDGQVVQLVINVQVPQPPTLLFSLLSPTNPPVPSGSAISVGVNASGDAAISNLSAVISGAATGALAATNGPNLVVQGVVSNTAVAGQIIEVLAQAVDTLGLPSGQKIFTVPVSDGTPPTIAILSPTNDALLAAGPSFALVVQAADNSSNVLLNLAISGALTLTRSAALSLTPNVTATNVFTVPLAGAPTNGGLIIATISATDLSSNESTLSRSFWLPGTVGPSIASLIIASNQPPLGGLTVPIQAALATNEAGISVRFFQDGNLVGVVTNAPYQVEVKLPTGGSTTIRAIATDPFGFSGPAAQLVIAVQTNILPTLQFTRVSPPTGPIPSGSSFAVEIRAAGNPGVFQISATIGGVANAGTVTTTGTNLLVQGSVPATAIAGQQITITAQAADGLGQSTGPQVFTLNVSDGTPPSLTILSPPQNDQLVPGQPFDMAVLVGDNSASVTLGLSITGSVSTVQSQQISLTPNVPMTNIFAVSLPTEPTNGSPLVATVTATDAAGNRTVVESVFWLPGSQTTVLWERQALGQTFTCTNGQGSYTWPNNNNWSQAAVFGDPCHTGTNVVVAPSNWSTTNYPNNPGLDVVLGSVGGASVNLDTGVTLHSLTIQSDGALAMSSPGPGSSLTAVDFFFEGDGALARNGCCSPTTLLLTNGIMAKTGGTNVFSLDPAIMLTSLDGTLEADSGTLALPGNNSYYTNGAFNVASNASIDLVPSGNTANFSGTFAGAGNGSVVLNAGTVSGTSGGVTFDLPPPLFQWSGGAFAGSVGNAGFVNLSGTNDGVLANRSQFLNFGTFQHSGSGRLGLNGNGGGTTSFMNLPTGIYQFLGDSSVFQNNCCGTLAFDNQGLLWKSAGTGTSTISIPFNNQDGRVQVDSGELAFTDGGSSSNGTFTVAANASVDLTGGSSPSWQGLMSGAGGGQILLSSGAINAAGLTLNMSSNLFQWSGGTLAGTASNESYVTISGTNDSILANQATFLNAGTVQHTGSGRLGLNGNGGGTTSFENLPTGVYQFVADSSVLQNNCCGTLNFDNQGLLWKSGGTNTSSISVAFNNQDGQIRVDSGELVLNGGGNSLGGTFTVAGGAVLDLTGGNNPGWQGLISGTGNGEVLFGSGSIGAHPSLTLDFTNSMFHWSGGTFAGVITNTGIVDLAGTNDSILANQSEFFNLGTVEHTGAGRLGFNGNGGGTTAFNNLPGAVYQFMTDSSVFQNNCCGTLNFNNAGTLWKSAGTNSSGFYGVSYSSLGGTIRVDSGALILGAGSSVDGAFIVAAGATVDLTGNSQPTWAGLMSGSGAGRVVLASGTLNAPGLTLDFIQNMFQWSGGLLAGTVTNQAFVSISGTNDSLLANQSRFYNAGTLLHLGSGRLGFNGNGGGTTAFENLPTGIYQFLTDSSIFQNNCCGTLAFDNQGLLWKSAGTNTSAVSIAFNNQNGQIRVDSGQLVLNGGGNSIGGNFTIAAGAVLDLTGGSNPGWQGLLTGSGAGQAVFGSGTIGASPSLTLDFTNSLFRWTGGTFSGVVTNLGTIVMAGANDCIVANQARFYNAGLVQHSGSGRLGLNGNGGGTTAFENLPGGVYQFLSDSSVFQNNCCGTLEFDNAGLLWKSGGTNTSTIAVTFNNQNGSIEVDSGTLTLAGGNYAQGSGALTVKLGGLAAGQSGSLNVGGNAVLGGPLNVVLTNGYSPALGDQFQILSSANLSGTFSAVQVPAGFIVTNIGANVFVRFTGAGAQVAVGKGSGHVLLPVPGWLLFSGASNSTWQVWLATNLQAPAWLPLGSVYVTNSAQFWRDPETLPAPQRYYRVLRSP